MRIIYFDYYYDDSGQTLRADCSCLKDLSVTSDDFINLKDFAENSIINHCEELYDNIASNNVEVTQEEEDIASDVLQGLFKIVIRRKKY